LLPARGMAPRELQRCRTAAPRRAQTAATGGSGCAASASSPGAAGGSGCPWPRASPERWASRRARAARPTGCCCRRRRGSP
jgi:hypothetical protein